MAMTIREFADELINTLKTTFPDLFEHASFAVQTVPKPGNLLLTGITVNFHGSNIAPCYYIDEQYNKCLEGTPLSAVASDLAETIRQTSDFQPNIDITAIQDFASAKDHIFPRLIDARPGKNDDYLAKRVSTAIPGTDISVIYEIALSDEEVPRMTLTVTDELAEMWNIPLEELHAIAVQNAVKQRPLYFTDMNGILNSLAPEDFPEFEVESMLYVLTNKQKIHGASVILYPEAAKMLHDHFPNGFHVLPSSIHELIIVPKALSDNPEELKMMVMAINASEVMPADQLSDSVYTLDASGNLTVVL